MEVSRNQVMMRKALFAPFILQDLKREQTNLLSNKELTTNSLEPSCEQDDDDECREESFLTTGGSDFVPLTSQIDEQYLSILDPNMFSGSSQYLRNSLLQKTRRQFSAFPGAEDTDLQQAIDVERTGLSKVVAIMMLERNNAPKKANTIISFYKKISKKSWFFHRYGPKPKVEETSPSHSPNRKSGVTLCKEPSVSATQGPLKFSFLAAQCSELQVEEESVGTEKASVSPTGSPSERNIKICRLNSKRQFDTQSPAKIREHKSPKATFGLSSSPSKTSLKTLKLEDVFKKILSHLVSEVVQNKPSEDIVKPSSITAQDEGSVTEVAAAGNQAEQRPREIRSPKPSQIVMLANADPNRKSHRGEESSPSKSTRSIRDVFNLDERPAVTFAQKIDLFGRVGLKKFSLEPPSQVAVQPVACDTKNNNSQNRENSSAQTVHTIESEVVPILGLRHSVSSVEMKATSSVNLASGVKGSTKSPKKCPQKIVGIAQVFQSLPKQLSKK